MQPPFLGFSRKNIFSESVAKGLTDLLTIFNTIWPLWIRGDSVTEDENNESHEEDDTEIEDENPVKISWSDAYAYNTWDE